MCSLRFIFILRWSARHARGLDVDLSELLLEKGLKADARAKDGATPNELAEEEEHDDAVEAPRASR